MATGRRFRVLNVVDDVTRECLAAVPDTSISGRRVVRELTDLIAVRGKPGMIVSDRAGPPNCPNDRGYVTSIMGCLLVEGGDVSE